MNAKSFIVHWYFTLFCQSFEKIMDILTVEQKLFFVKLIIEMERIFLELLKPSSTDTKIYEGMRMTTPLDS